jgi:hypothetical protein
MASDVEERDGALSDWRKENDNFFFEMHQRNNNIIPAGSLMLTYLKEELSLINVWLCAANSM